jgi:hypothetical protein
MIMAEKLSAPVDPNDRARATYRAMVELTMTRDEIEAHAINGQTCGYFALCDNQAVGHIRNPFVDPVPTCNRCRERFGLNWAQWQY